jgi:hypothetical protein
MNRIFAAVSVAALTIATSAFAQTTTTTTTVIEETTAPVSQVVVVPDTVRTYVTTQSMPSVVLEGPLVVGQPLPDTVQYQVIPDNDGYAYAIVNEKRVIIDPTTRSVIEVYD